MRDRQIFKKLFGPFVDVEHSELQIQNGFACNAEQEMARFDYTRVNGANWHLKNTFAFDRAEFVPFALKWRKLCAQIEIFAEGRSEEHTSELQSRLHLV